MPVIIIIAYQVIHHKCSTFNFYKGDDQS